MSDERAGIKIMQALVAERDAPEPYEIAIIHNGERLEISVPTGCEIAIDRDGVTGPLRVVVTG